MKTILISILFAVLSIPSIAFSQTIEVPTVEIPEVEIDDPSEIGAGPGGDPLPYPTTNFNGILVDNRFPMNIRNATETPLYWDVLTYNTSNVEFDGRLTDSIVVPAGINFVRVSASVAWDANITGTRFIWIDINNSYSSPGRTVSGIPAHNYAMVQSVRTTVMQVREGDILKVMVYQDSGISLGIAANDATWFSVEFIN